MNAEDIGDAFDEACDAARRCEVETRRAADELRAQSEALAGLSILLACFSAPAVPS